MIFEALGIEIICKNAFQSKLLDVGTAKLLQMF